MVYGETSNGTEQEIELLAKILNFTLRSIETNIGGNTGTVTVEIEGSKFDNTMQIALENGTNTNLQVKFPI